MGNKAIVCLRRTPHLQEKMGLYILAAQSHDLGGALEEESGLQVGPLLGHAPCRCRSVRHILKANIITVRLVPQAERAEKPRLCLRQFGAL